MNTRIPSLGRRASMRRTFTLVAVAGLLALRLVPLSPARAADAKPPEVMSYQGFLVDANGDPLAPDNPANYPVIFRIFDQATGGTRLWSEQQIVTIDKGNFSVLLGEGTEVSGESRPPLSQVFGGSGLAANASDRFLGVTVTINNVPTEILPRLRLLPAPYAYLARHANALVNAVGQPLVAAGSGDNLVVAGRLTANEFAGNGAALNNLDASKITSGTLADARLPGNLARRDQHNIFTMNVQVNGTLRVGEIGNFPISSKGYGPALIFSGGPDLSPFWSNDNSDPLWIARYNEAENQSELRINIGDDPGLPTDKLVIGTTSGGGPDFNQSGVWTPSVAITAQGFIGVGTTAPPYPLTIHNNDINNARLRIQQSNGKYADFGRGDKFLYVQLNQSYHDLNNRFASYDGDANWDFGSDRKLKKDIVDAEPMLDRALKVQVRRFRWKDDPDDAKHMLGVVAQELQPLFPDLVGEITTPDTGEKILTVGYGDFALIAVKALQELKAQYDARMSQLEARMERLAALETKAARVDALEREVAALKRLVQELAHGNDARNPGTEGPELSGTPLVNAPKANRIP